MPSFHIYFRFLHAACVGKFARSKLDSPEVVEGDVENWGFWAPQLLGGHPEAEDLPCRLSF